MANSPYTVRSVEGLAKETELNAGEVFRASMRLADNGLATMIRENGKEGAGATYSFGITKQGRFAADLLGEVA